MAALYKKVMRKLEYIRNKSRRYDFPATNGEWVKKANPVYGDENTDSVFDPYVLFFDGMYRLYVSERKNNGVDVCISADGVHWEKVGQALAPCEATDWEEKVNRVSVCCNAGKWYMWYTGQNTKGSQIGLAVSNDGYRFDRITENPVLKPELSFEKQSVMNPCVLWDEDKLVYKMWYAAGELFEPDVLCYAESKDGMSWVKHSRPILEKSDNNYDSSKVGGCDVKKLSSSEYVMYYIGYQNVDTARICCALSHDGIDWTRIVNNPVLSPEKDSWDSDAVYKPAVILRDTWQLWYNGRKGNKEYIGYARREREQQ